MIVLKKECILYNIGLGLGDLLWKSNLGNQIVENHNDTFYYSNDIEYIYCTHKIQINDKLRILDKTLIDKNIDLQNVVIDWKILSNYILYQQNVCSNKLKVVIFHDSLLISVLSLYLEMFNEVFTIKSKYDNTIISTINPDYVFEFRVKRFLN